MVKNFKDVKVGDRGKDILGLEGKVIAKGMFGWLIDVDATATRIEGNTEDIDADAVAVEMLDNGEVYICVYGPDGFLVDEPFDENKKIEKSPYREQNLNELKRIIESKEDELGGFKLGKINDVLNGVTYDYRDVYENDDGHLVIVVEDPECGSVDVCTDVTVEIKALMDSRVIMCAYIDDYQDTAYVENVFPTFTSDGVNTTIEDFIKEYEEKTQSGSLNESKKLKESQKLQENVQSGDIFIIRGKGGDADYVNDVAKEMQSPMCMVDGKKAFKMTIEQVEELLGECDPGCFNMWECPSIQEESFDSDTLIRIHDIESAVWDRD